MLMRGFAVALTPMNLLFGAIGCTFGTFIGAMPGSALRPASRSSCP